MEPGTASVFRPDRLYSTLAGLEAGILGGLLFLSWVLMVADWRGNSSWGVLNLFGGWFYPELSFRPDYSPASLPGLALMLFSSGCVGTAFGAVVAPVASIRRRILLGLITSLCWFYLSFALLWKRYNPPLFYFADRNIFLLGHLLFGLALGFQPWLAASLSCTFRGKPAAPEALPPTSPGGGNGSRIE